MSRTERLGEEPEADERENDAEAATAVRAEHKVSEADGRQRDEAEVEALG